MNYIVLLRKINVGKENRIDKQSLKNIFIDLNYDNVHIYINSGNILFESEKNKHELRNEIEIALFNLFNTKIDFMILTTQEMICINNSIPCEWENNNDQKTDIAFLFEEVNKPEILDELPFKKEFIDLIYINNALIMHVKRENQNKSQLSKIISNRIYKHMTIRNVNTVRYLANYS